MPLDTLPGNIVTYTRDQVVELWKRDYRCHDPVADTSPGTQPDIDARTFADSVMPLYANSISAGTAMTEITATGDDLNRIGQAIGVARGLASGAAGSVTITTSVGGSTIFANDEIRDAKTSVRFKCTTTGLYLSGAQVPIVGIDTGPGTNLSGGTLMTWTAPRPGCSQSATVVTQADGSGLTGGRDPENDESYKLSITAARSRRPASGNSGEYQTLVEGSTTVPVQKAFTYPAILGTGTMGVTFTLLPAVSGHTRIPSALQVATILAQLTGQMPHDDNIFVTPLFTQAFTVVYSVTWKAGSSGWTDLSPWPLYSATQYPKVSAATDATHFTLVTQSGGYGGYTAPTEGKTIAFFDQPNMVWRRKLILSVTGAGPWVIVCDTTNGASDTSYVPVVGQRCGPWSDSLPTLIAPTAAYFDSIGPGEQISPLPDPGARKRRAPVSPDTYPSTISNRLIQPILTLPSILDAAVTEGLGTATTVGSAGNYSYILELNSIVAYPQ